MVCGENLLHISGSGLHCTSTRWKPPQGYWLLWLVGVTSHPCYSFHLCCGHVSGVVSATVDKGDRIIQYMITQIMQYYEIYSRIANGRVLTVVVVDDGLSWLDQLFWVIVDQAQELQ